MKQTTVQYIAPTDDHSGGFDLRLGIPERRREDYAARAPQLDAIGWFYGFVPDDLSGSQANALLCMRDYAKAIVGSLNLQIWGAEEKTLSIFTAAFISNDPVIGPSVVRGMRQRWNNRSDPDELSLTVRRTKYYWEVATFVDQVLKDVDAWGSSLTPLSSAQAA